MMVFRKIEVSIPGDVLIKKYFESEAVRDDKTLQTGMSLSNTSSVECFSTRKSVFKLIYSIHML